MGKKSKNNKVETSKVESNKVESNKAESNKAESNKAESEAQHSTPVAIFRQDTAPALAQMRERVARRAYELFESRSPWEGSALEDWVQAEGELLDETSLELRDEGNTFVIEGALDHFAPEELDVQVWQDHVAIVGECHHESHAQHRKEGFEHFEHHRSFLRQFGLPQPVDPHGAKAAFTGGMLQIILPKQQETLDRA